MSRTPPARTQTTEALPEGRGAVTLYAQALLEDTSTICHHGNNENSHMIDLERNTTTLLQNFPVTAQFCAETKQFCAAAEQFFAETDQFFAATKQFCAAAEQFCAETNQFCAATKQFCAETDQFFAATKQFCAAAEQFFAETEQFYSMTQKNVSTVGERYPAIEKTFRTFKYKGKWAVRMRIYPYPNVKKI